MVVVIGLKYCDDQRMERAQRRQRRAHLSMDESDRQTDGQVDRPTDRSGILLELNN